MRMCASMAGKYILKNPEQKKKSCVKVTLIPDVKSVHIKSLLLVSELGFGSISSFRFNIHLFTTSFRCVCHSL